MTQLQLEILKRLLDHQELSFSAEKNRPAAGNEQSRSIYADRSGTGTIGTG